MYVKPVERADEESERLARLVIGAAIEVHRHLGPGFGEALYEEALCHEMEMRNIEYERQVPISVSYKGRCVGTGRIDLLVGRRLIVELKSVAAIEQIHNAQALAYLKATGNRLALVLNFNVPVMKQGIHRVIL